MITSLNTATKWCMGAEVLGSTGAGGLGCLGAISYSSAESMTLG